VKKCIVTGLSVSFSYKKGCRCQSCKDNKKRYTETDKEKSRERVRRWQKEHPERMREFRRKSVDKTWIYKYGELKVAQKGKCAICRSGPGGMSNSKFRLNVDHDHKTGQIRGLLCGSCNVGIGHLKDNIKFLYAAIKYLKNHEKQKKVHD